MESKLNIKYKYINGEFWKISWNCRICRKDCMEDPKDYYMLKDKLWLELNNGEEDGMLCMKCVEDLLGRKLHPQDIKLCPLTRSINPYTRKALSSYRGPIVELITHSTYIHESEAEDLIYSESSKY